MNWFSKAFLMVVVLDAALIGNNPADYDPFHDNMRDTYHFFAAAVPFPMPQEYPTDGHGHPLNGAGRSWVQPPKGPNGDACREVWDKQIPCSVDGKFYGYWGDLQPESCDDNYFMPDGRTLKPDADKCECNVAMTKTPDQCPMNDQGDPIQQMVDGPTCMKYCHTEHCHCVSICDAYVPEGQGTPIEPKNSKKTPASKDIKPLPKSKK